MVQPFLFKTLTGSSRNMPAVGTQRKIPEAPGLPYRLGRNVNHDDASRDYPVRRLVADKPIVSVRWRRNVAPYNQGDLGSCTANAALGCLSTAPWRGRYTSQRTIQRYYHDETVTDGLDNGVWPPDDTGSDGNTAGKVARTRGLITSWSHCFTVHDVLLAVQYGPLITGTDWTNGMFEPDGTGLVRPTGDVAGGHEWEIVGYDDDTKTLWACNSWGTNWALGGYFRIGVDDYTQLLAADGDATVFHK